MKSFVGIALALVLITGRPTLTRSEDWPNEGAILADYVEALRKMETFYAHIYARGSLTKIFHKPEGEIRQDVEIEFWCDGVNHLTREVSKDADETLRERLQGSNRDYRFVIVRDTLDRSFVIDDFIPASTSVSESVAEYPAPWKPDRGARRIRKKSYAKVFRASVGAETSRLPVCGSAARRNRRLG